MGRLKVVLIINKNSNYKLGMLGEKGGPSQKDTHRHSKEGSGCGLVHTHLPRPLPDPLPLLVAVLQYPPCPSAGSCPGLQQSSLRSPLSRPSQHSGPGPHRTTPPQPLWTPGTHYLWPSKPVLPAPHPSVSSAPGLAPCRLS